MSVKPGSFGDRFKRGETLFGTFLKISSTQPTEILASVDFDFVVVDEEHAPFNRETTDAIILACRAYGIGAIVRTQSADSAAILSILDCGADGVLVPHVDSPEKARQVVESCRYATGHRGFAPTTRAGRFGAAGMSDHIRSEDSRVIVIAMIEDVAAVEQIDEILAVDGIDGIFLGRADLAVSYGDFDGPSQKVSSATGKVMKAAKAAGIKVAILPANPQEAADLAQDGASAFVLASDQTFLRSAASSALQSFSETISEETSGGL